jgi:transposase
MKLEDRRLLTEEQEIETQNLITDRYPEQYQLPFALGTRKSVKELIEQKYGVVLAIRTMGEYLKRWGFTPQKPKQKAYEQNPGKVRKWLEEEYPRLKKRAKEENGEIHWGDETGCKNQSNHGRSYSPQGKTPVKESMSKQFKINMISTITNQGKVHFMIYSDSMNTERLMDFLKQLIKTGERKIFLVLDNLRVHHSHIVREWVKSEEAKRKLEIFWLPSYSPELNPDEYLNCDLKHGLSHKPATRSVKELRENVENHMNMSQQTPSRIAKYFKHKSIKYAA